jgi:hypothetical protein
MCRRQNEIDRIVPKGFDFFRLGIIPPALHSHFLSPQLCHLFAASLIFYTKTEDKKHRINNDDSKAIIYKEPFVT